MTVEEARRLVDVPGAAVTAGRYLVEVTGVEVTFELLQRLSIAFGTKAINIRARNDGYCDTCGDDLKAVIEITLPEEVTGAAP